MLCCVPNLGPEPAELSATGPLGGNLLLASPTEGEGRFGVDSGVSGHLAQQFLGDAGILDATEHIGHVRKPASQPTASIRQQWLDGLHRVASSLCPDSHPMPGVGIGMLIQLSGRALQSAPTALSERGQDLPAGLAGKRGHRWILGTAHQVLQQQVVPLTAQGSQGTAASPVQPPPQESLSALADQGGIWLAEGIGLLGKSTKEHLGVPDQANLAGKPGQFPLNGTGPVGVQQRLQGAQGAAQPPGCHPQLVYRIG